ncbi:MAG: T9SS type A sorting domain-containing protein, partial [Chitinophagales bacterium]|nr:T9SS type A sorting domain-containing protein [Chitinophagales bacterium]MBL7787097.1 T9SS type A sorting domain-containing protein [Chitinophagales bacterium]
NTNTDETATVTLLDLSGKTVAINNEYATAGSNEFGIDTNQLPAGIYLVRLQTPTQSFTERLVIAR